jgi:ComF family protein
MWQRLWATLLDAVFPPRCVTRGCGGAGSWWCARCLAAVQPLPSPRCGRCGLALAGAACLRCASRPPSFRRAACGGVYAPPLRDAIHALKYRGVRPLAEPLGRLAAAALGPVAPETLVVAVPSHGSRVAERGIDHTALLAASVARALGRPAVPALERRRPTRPQVGLTPRERRANVAGAFRAVGPVAGHSLVLVDDVLTSGATGEACARELLAAGALAVDVCTVARALRRAPAAGAVPARRL